MSPRWVPFLLVFVAATLALHLASASPSLSRSRPYTTAAGPTTTPSTAAIAVEADERFDASASIVKDLTPPKALTSRQLLTDTTRFLLAFATAFSGELGQLWVGTAYCSWPGVSCTMSEAADAAGDSRQEVRVTLSNYGLNGQLPELPEGVDGSNVRVVTLDVSVNPGIVGGFPSTWGRLSLIRNIDVSKTSIVGKLPNVYNNMRSLRNFTAADTQLLGGTPNWNIPNLEHIDLSGCGLKGSLSAAWGYMEHLSFVDLSGNIPCGCVPKTFLRRLALMDAVYQLGNQSNTTLTLEKCAKENRCTGRYEPVPYEVN